MPRLPRRRHPATRTRDTAVRSMFHNAIEALESRTLFNTIMNDGDGVGVFEYKDARNQVVRVTFHNVTAELVFARVRASDNQVVLGDATPGFDTVNDGKDLFTIYVAEAGANSFITIAEVPPPTANVRPMQPFSGSVNLTVRNAQTGQLGTTSVGPGSVYLGARTRDTPANIANEADRPILSDNFSGLGILGPRSNGRLTAGLIVESGQDLHKFYFGGAISGEVTLGGSINEFYCGALVTGDTFGEFEGQPSNPSNFFVAGDLRNLFVGGSIGTNNGGGRVRPTYLSGFDLEVIGSVGLIRSETFSGGGDIHNDAAAPRIRARQRELEFRIDPGRNRGDATNFEGTDNFFFDNPDLEGIPRLGDNQAMFNNDTFETAQYLGVFNSRTLGKDSISVEGIHQYTQQIADPVDYYGVALLAGQSVTVQLFSAVEGVVIGPNGERFVSSNLLNVGVFDPDGRLISTDYNPQSDEFNPGDPFTFTADRPGVYRFAVSVFGDADFDGGQSGEFGVPFGSENEYRLEIKGAGNLALGGLYCAQNFFDGRTGFFIDPDGSGNFEFGSVGSVRVRQGDIGGVFAAGFILSEANNTFEVANGHLRSLDADSLGQLVGTFNSGPTIAVPRGTVGLIRASGTGGEDALLIDTVADLASLFDPEIDFDDELDFFLPIGGDVQLIDAARTFQGDIIVSGSIGTIRAAQLGVANDTPIIAANADGKGAPGTIDLIDVTGNFGAIAPGGPHISTGPGGNVRYIRVGGTVFRDRFFGSGQPEEITADAGESLSFVDDSGTLIGVKPIPLRRVVTPGTGGSVLDNPGTLTASFYGIRGSGGGALIRVASTRGVEVTSTSQTGRSTAEIGVLNLQGGGTPVVQDDRGTVRPEDDVLELEDPIGSPGADFDNDLDVRLRGNSIIDVFEITFSENPDGAVINEGNFTSIINETGGELVNINAVSIGELRANTLGLAKRNTAAAVNGIRILDPTFFQNRADTVFEQQRIGVVSGNIVRAMATQGLGNFIVTGVIQEIIANADGRFTKGEYEGINAPILALIGGGLATTFGGEIRYINIGEGVLPSGTGNMSKAGIYAEGFITTIENQGLGSDIRGDIIVTASSRLDITVDPDLEPVELFGPSIVTIGLTDGAIIGSDILVVSSFDQGRDFNFGFVLPDNDFASDTNPVSEIGTIGLNGVGGIIGTSIVASDIGDVVVNGGFGIVSSEFLTGGLGVLDNIVTDGLGIRSTVFSGGGAINNMTARGNGKRVATTAYTPSVRLSENSRIDPYFGTTPNGLTDLHVYLGTSAAAPVRKGLSTSAVIADVDARGGREVGLIQAHQIKSSAFNFANRIDRMIVRDYIDDLSITTGRLNFAQTGGDMFSVDWTVSGPIGTINVGGTYRGTNLIRAIGANGQLGTFTTGRSFYGTLVVTNDAQQVRVGTDFGAPGTTFAGLDVGRNVNSLVVNGSVLDGAVINVDDHLASLSIGGDVQEDAVISVETLGTSQIGGDVFGDVIIRSDE